jgi:threonine synthase
MGLQKNIVVAINENDILDRFWNTRHYEKKASHGAVAEEEIPVDGAKAYEDGIKEIQSSNGHSRLLQF